MLQPSSAAPFVRPYDHGPGDAFGAAQPPHGAKRRRVEPQWPRDCALLAPAGLDASGSMFEAALSEMRSAPTAQPPLLRGAAHNALSPPAAAFDTQIMQELAQLHSTSWRVSCTVLCAAQ
ncbi:MAG: hypothetical protein EOO40_07860, partial [Deltaproteobacteria bacterium]